MSILAPFLAYSPRWVQKTSGRSKVLAWVDKGVFQYTKGLCTIDLISTLDQMAYCNDKCWIVVPKPLGMNTFRLFFYQSKYLL